MFDDLKNNFEFYLRNKIRLTRKNFIEKNLDLIKRNELENLYTTDILSQAFVKRGENLQVLDIGCKNWFYAKGEYDFFKRFCKNIKLDGIEIDAFRLYSNFYNRYEVAKYYTKGLINTNYIVGNMLDLRDKYDYIIWFLPFVVYEPHKYWGLPKKYFYPEKLLEHAYSLLKQNGQMLIINQGEKEYEVQKLMLDKLGITYIALNEVKSKHFEYKNKRFGIVVEK